MFIKNATVLSIVKEAQPETHILIKGGKIVAVGRDLVPDEGMTVIDATGRYVMPGIIDTHSHIMFQDALGGVNEATMSIVPKSAYATCCVPTTRRRIARWRGA